MGIFLNFLSLQSVLGKQHGAFKEVYSLTAPQVSCFGFQLLATICSLSVHYLYGDINRLMISPYGLSCFSTVAVRFDLEAKTDCVCCFFLFFLNATCLGFVSPQPTFL